MEISVFDGRTAVEHAQDAAAAVRAINHLTFHDTALRYPSDAWRLVGGFGSVAGRLPQAFEQTAARVRRWHEAGQLGIDPGTTYANDPAGAVEDACHALTREASIAAAAMARALDVALGALTYAHHLDLAEHAVEVRS